LGERPAKLSCEAEIGQPGELPAQGFYLRCAVQSEQAAKLSGRVFLHALGAFDAQQGHQKESEQDCAQAVKGGTDRAVDLFGDLEDPALDQGGDGQEHTGSLDLGAGAEKRGGIIEQSQTGHQPIAAAIGRIAIQRAGKVFVQPLAIKTGQVWVRTLRFCPCVSFGAVMGASGLLGLFRRLKTGQVWVRILIELGKAGLFRRLILPAKAPERFAHSHLADAKPTGDFAVAYPLCLPAVEQLCTRSGETDRSLRAAIGSAKPAQAARLKAPQIAPHGSHIAVESTCYLRLPGPALLDQTDHGVGLTGTISDRIVGKRQGADHYHSIAITCLNATPLIDDDNAVVASRNLLPAEQLLLRPV